MRIDVLTLFPRMIEEPLGQSIIGKAVEKDLLEINVHDFRQYSDNKHKQVDDYPYGGGAGMLLKVQPIFENLKAIEAETGIKKNGLFCLTQLGNPLIKKWQRIFPRKSNLCLFVDITKAMTSEFAH